MSQFREYRNGPMDGYVEEVSETDTGFSSGMIYSPQMLDVDGPHSGLWAAYGYRETKFKSDDDYCHFFDYLGSASSEKDASTDLKRWMKGTEYRRGLKAWRKRRNYPD